MSTTTTTRDYVAEMNDYIGKELDTREEWVAPLVASDLARRLTRTDPDLLQGWLAAMAENLLRTVITQRASSMRAQIRNRVQARAFGEAAQGEDRGKLGLFAVRHCADDAGTMKRAADMTGREHLYVAENTYQRRANTLMMEAEFHRAVARKVGKRRTGDVMDEAAYERMYQSVVKAPRGMVA